MGGWRRSRFPGDSRTSVLAGTWAGLTSGFGMGPGVPRRYGRQNHHTMTGNAACAASGSGSNFGFVVLCLRVLFACVVWISLWIVTFRGFVLCFGGSRV